MVKYTTEALWVFRSEAYASSIVFFDAAKISTSETVIFVAFDGPEGIKFGRQVGREDGCDDGCHVGITEGVQLG